MEGKALIVVTHYTKVQFSISSVAVKPRIFLRQYTVGLERLIHITCHDLSNQGHNFSAANSKVESYILSFARKIPIMGFILPTHRGCNWNAKQYGR
jgi:hypothetical protein